MWLQDEDEKTGMAGDKNVGGEEIWGEMLELIFG